jgi:hypothetical protein
LEERSNLTLRPWEYKLLEPNNPWYPLPADYPDLSEDGQREARIAAVCRQRTPLEFVAAWDTFRRLYFMTTPEGFFYHKLAPSPEFHYEMICDVGTYGRNVFAAPRGFAKSIVIGTELPVFLDLTRSRIRLVLCMATDKLIEGRFEKLAQQLTENKQILADFGDQRPVRGQGIWNKHHLTLRNGSTTQGFSVTGRKRGARPDLFILDDPEYDDSPNSETGGLISREKFENFLFQQVVPMLEKGSGVVWIGTVIGKQSFLSYALTGNDSRFDYWNKKHYRSGDPDSEDPQRRRLLWPTNWDANTLRIRKQEIGPEAYAKEYMNEAGSGTERTLILDPRKNHYLVETPDEIYEQNPLQSISRITTNHMQPDKGWKWIPLSVEARQLFSRFFILITVDSAKTVSIHSDFSCVLVSAFDSDNCLWLLDMWLGRCSHEQLLNHIFRLGFKWQARVIGIESCSTQVAVLESCRTMLSERKISGWDPHVVPVDYQQTNDRTKKAQRIATLEWRFSRGKIKLPAHLLGSWPWQELVAEINDFTYDLSMLAHDDALDTVAMNHYVVHGRGANEVPPPPRQSLSQKIAAGDVYVTGSISRLSGMNASEFTPDLVEAIVMRAYNLGQKGLVPPCARKPYDTDRYRKFRGGGRKDAYHAPIIQPSTLVSIGGRLGHLLIDSHRHADLPDENSAETGGISGVGALGRIGGEGID